MGFSGTFQVLLNRLSRLRENDTTGWPRTPKGLSNMLKRQAPALRRVDIDIQFDEQRRADGFYVMIKRNEA